MSFALGEGILKEVRIGDISGAIVIGVSGGLILATSIYWGSVINYAIGVLVPQKREHVLLLVGLAVLFTIITVVIIIALIKYAASNFSEGTPDSRRFSVTYHPKSDEWITSSLSEIEDIAAA